MPHTRAEALTFRNITVADLAFPDRDTGYQKGRATREQILHAALVILVAEGHTALTMRRIAAACDMKLGNLTYHYPSREDLMTELLEAVISAYELEFDKLDLLQNVSAEHRLAEICGLVLEDIRSEKTTRIFPELWVLANHDQFILERTQELYERARRPIKNCIREMRPDLSDEAIDDLAVFISASMEGMTIFAGHKKPYEHRMPSYELIAIQAFVDLVQNYQSTQED